MLNFCSKFNCGYSSVVERLLAKEKVAGSNPVARSNKMFSDSWTFLLGGQRKPLERLPSG